MKSTEFPNYEFGKEPDASGKKEIKSPGGETFRKDLASNMKSIEDHKVRNEALKSEQGTWRYKKAAEAHKEKNEKERSIKESKEEVVKKIGSPYIRISEIENIPNHDELCQALREWAQCANEYRYEDNEANSKKRERAREKVTRILENLGYQHIEFGNPTFEDEGDNRFDKLNFSNEKGEMSFVDLDYKAPPRERARW